MKPQIDVAVLVLLGFLLADPARAQIADGEQKFQAMAAALKANDAERRSAIETCIGQGVGSNLAGLAEFMGVPEERATEAWCTRMTNGIANGRLTLADVNALNEGTITPGAQEVLTTASEGR